MDKRRKRPSLNIASKNGQPWKSLRKRKASNSVKANGNGGVKPVSSQPSPTTIAKEVPPEVIDVDASLPSDVPNTFQVDVSPLPLSVGLFSR